MEILNNISLKNYNTFHMDSVAKNLYVPENEDELIFLIEKLKLEKYYVLSNGSNIILNNEKEYENVIYMKKVDCQISMLDDSGKFYIGASNRIQNVINVINEQGYGGIEQLYSIPAMFGGIIYMNAGIGARSNPVVTISDYVEKVKALNKVTGKIEYLKNAECNFSHRKSIFQNDAYIIIGAECKFYKQDIETSKKIIKERLEYFGKRAEMGKGTFGTVFSMANRKLLRISSIFLNRKGGVHFASNNKNWLVNEGSGTYKDTMYLINNIIKIHKVFKQEIECEVRIWG